MVEMPNKDEAEKAVAALNGKDMKGRNLTFAVFYCGQIRMNRYMWE